jgi:hypothetical protein
MRIWISSSAVALALVAFVLLAPARGADTPTPARVEFNRDVRPILSDNCFHCHGPDQNAREAELRLDIRDEAIKEAGSGATPIVPGKAADSELVRRILSKDAEERMPPPDSHKKLTLRQKQILERWVEQGAEYQQHWSFEPPVKPDIPADQNGIDFLVRKRLVEIGLKPSPEADRRTLIRRLYFDLLGLPPTPQEIAEFVNDPSSDAYENLLDIILANPHYGERMALGWLDVVRFADTCGYHSDKPINIWPYRDWVIQSFNDNKPFDRFTQEQVAGDLLPDGSQETRVGSAFNRLLLTTDEGGAQPKDYEARMLTDRVRAVGAVWLGLTTGCAQCHDHKFDPFTTRDFYSLGAFFADIEEALIAPREDGMSLSTPQQEKQLKKFDAQLAKATKELDAAQLKWEGEIIANKIVLPELRPNSQAGDVDRDVARRVVRIVQRQDKKRVFRDQRTVKTYFRDKAKDFEPTAHEAFAKATERRDAYFRALPHVIVSKSAKKKRIVRILPRGNWMDESGEIVRPALPRFLPQPNVEGRDLTRLDLANWLVARDNPLTARTVMNRMWQQFFGAGLSRVLDDLGGQGEPPVNPALLDWLACEFMDSGWDMQHMVRLIVTSHTYRQVSTASPELVAADPLNRELARQSRFRLDAELVRDNALATAGLLDLAIGGPSAKPYQPAKYWEDLNFPPREYVADKGLTQYRRGLYTWRQRTFPHPSLMAFDASTREACTAERTRSNIPQQALVLLNDPTYVEAARVFASRILLECAGPTDERMNWAWQQALQRDPTATELEAMEKLLAARLADYRANAASADALLKIGIAPLPKDIDKAELAAWTHVTRVLLNLHETITRS